MALSIARRDKQREADKVHMKRVRLSQKSDKALAKATENAEAAVNKFVRRRDEGKPCISCGAMKPHTAGHHRSVASAPELRFNTKNINGQCWGCNGGHVHKYQDDTIGQRYDAGVVQRFGQTRLDWVKGPHQLKRYRVDDLNRIRRIFARREKLYQRIREKNGG